MYFIVNAVMYVIAYFVFGFWGIFGWFMINWLGPYLIMVAVALISYRSPNND